MSEEREMASRPSGPQRPVTEEKDTPPPLYKGVRDGRTLVRWLLQIFAFPSF